VFVFPALWDEPFGIVALEAIASGVVVTGYQSGGLAEAVGPCGVLVAKGDRRALVGVVNMLLGARDERERLLAHRAEHLHKHRARIVAERYVTLLKDQASVHKPRAEAPGQVA
jgi:glycosyltransferase involved in cell wall biosynthesis